MEYVAMFVWLVLCLVLGGLMHAALHSAFNHGWVKLLAAPGVTIRKLAMTTAALATGATVTDVNVYRISDREIGFEGSGPAGISKILVPIAPLFACALVLQAVNRALGSPIDLNFSPPDISSLDAGGAVGFMKGLFALVTQIAQRAVEANWQSGSLYVLLIFVFSFSLGAGVPFEKLREAFLGVLILVLGVALICALFGLRPGMNPAEVLATPGPAVRWMRSVRAFLMSTAGMSLIMMLCGIFASVIVGLTARLFQMFGEATSKKKPGPAAAEGAGKGKKKQKQAA